MASTYYTSCNCHGYTQQARNKPIKITVRRYRAKLCGNLLQKSKSHPVMSHSSRRAHPHLCCDYLLHSAELFAVHKRRECHIVAALSCRPLLYYSLAVAQQIPLYLCLQQRPHSRPHRLLIYYIISRLC
ncbi:hypothetical protein J6590_029447 [Homalodisca vitripennis]|nr:hypothetical protein J6590_029447 [Homalodisca vitripennis]